MKKYLLCPGYVISENDFDENYLSAIQLRKLYDVPMNECIIKNARMSKTATYDGLIKLEPRHDGNYTIPGENSEKI